MLTGNPPWHEYEGVAAIFKIATQEPPIHQIPKSASVVAREFLAVCMCRDKDRRPTSEELMVHKFVNEFTWPHWWQRHGLFNAWLVHFVSFHERRGTGRSCHVTGQQIDRLHYRLRESVKVVRNVWNPFESFLCGGRFDQEEVCLLISCSLNTSLNVWWQLTILISLLYYVHAVASLAQLTAIDPES